MVVPSTELIADANTSIAKMIVIDVSNLWFLTLLLRIIVPIARIIKIRVAIKPIVDVASP